MTLIEERDSLIFGYYKNAITEFGLEEEFKEITGSEVEEHELEVSEGALLEEVLEAAQEDYMLFLTCTQPREYRVVIPDFPTTNESPETENSEPDQLEGERVLIRQRGPQTVQSKRTGEVVNIQEPTDEMPAVYEVVLDGAGEAHVTRDALVPVDGVQVPAEKPNHEVSLSDTAGSITQTSGFHDPDTELERGDFEVGVQNGDGYLKLPAFPDREVFRFSIPKEEVERYLSNTEDRYPFPDVPDGFEEPRDAPGESQGGDAVHTGGGIYCRIWKVKHPRGNVEVTYGVPDCDGVGVNLYDSDYEWVRNIDQIGLTVKTDDNAARIAQVLVQAVQEGEYDDEILAVVQS